MAKKYINSECCSEIVDGRAVTHHSDGSFESTELDKNPEKRQILIDWIHAFLQPRKTQNERISSYGLKHCAEDGVGFYVSNHEMKDAMLLAGWQPANPEPLNWWWNISNSSPALLYRFCTLPGTCIWKKCVRSVYSEKEMSAGEKELGHFLYNRYDYPRTDGKNEWVTYLKQNSLSQEALSFFDVEYAEYKEHRKNLIRSKPKIDYPPYLRTRSANPFFNWMKQYYRNVDSPEGNLYRDITCDRAFPKEDDPDMMIAYFAGNYCCETYDTFLGCYNQYWSEMHTGIPFPVKP